MMLYKDEQRFLERNKLVIGTLLKRRIEDFKNKIIAEEDEVKRDKLIKWVKEFQFCVNTLQQLDKEPTEKDLTGV